jgi:hypothetical protein
MKTHSIKKRLGLFLASLLIFSLVLSWGQEASNKDSVAEGRRIAEKSDQVNRGYVDERVESTMYLINSNRDTVVRQIVTLNLERDNSEDYSIIQFLNPPDVKGTGLLTYQNPRGDDKQWLYLPELRRVKKLSSRNKSGSFMGSEFSYEDISANNLDKFKYKKVGEGDVNGIPCYIVEKYPTYKGSGYTRIKSWISKDNYLLQRAEYFDRKKSLLKVQTIEGWNHIQGKTWRSDRIIMENLQTKKKSILNFGQRKLDIGLKKSQFTQRALQRLIKN